MRYYPFNDHIVRDVLYFFQQPSPLSVSIWHDERWRRPTVDKRLVRSNCNRKPTHSSRASSSSMRMCSFASRTALRACLRASPATLSAFSASATFCLAARIEDSSRLDRPNERSEDVSKERRWEKNPPGVEFVGEGRVLSYA